MLQAIFISHMCVIVYDINVIGFMIFSLKSTLFWDSLRTLFIYTFKITIWQVAPTLKFVSLICFGIELYFVV